MIPAPAHSLDYSSHYTTPHVQRSGESNQISQSNVFEFPSKRLERDFFIARFRAYLRGNFRNPEQVSVAFNVRFQTALNWWNGDNCPAGVPVMRAMHDPAFIEAIVGANNTDRRLLPARGSRRG